MATMEEQKTKSVSEKLKFESLQSTIDSTFWQEFGRKKIDEFKLSEEHIDIYAKFTGGISHYSNVTLPPKIFLDQNCFDNNDQTQYYFQIPGKLINCNKKEDFRKIDQKKLLKDTSIEMFNDIISNPSKILENPSLLYRFFILCFANLKKHRYSYWCCFPALLFENMQIISKKCTSFTERFHVSQMDLIVKNYQSFYKNNSKKENCLLFAVKKDLSMIALSELKGGDLVENVLMFAYIDNGSLPHNPCWFLRNILLFLCIEFKLFNSNFQLFCIRNLTNNLLDSLILDVCVRYSTSSKGNNICIKNLRSTGWERDSNHKLQSKVTDLSSFLDPKQLAKESVSLNLKLMRWRRAPDLDLNAISSKKYVLCGAGTLGCYTARTLLGWGVTHISLIDNGKVSYSNPVRQCLYTHSDCIESDNFKAEIAAKRLMEINPNAQCKGHVLSIPMPGHYVSASEMSSTKSAFEEMCKIVSESDVVFLLTDSRESRWLPTVLGKFYNKIVINVALGFDSYLIQRHSFNNDNLGCYFCSDVVAPTDSISDRSLDQQCTTSRPGLAPIASGLAVELMVSLLQKVNEKDGKHSLCKEIPSQIRGHLYDFSNICISEVQAYDKCPACSPSILSEFEKHQFEFVLNALNKPKFLETVSGLAEMVKNMDLDNIDIEWDDGDD